jgi:hypothetical protein
VGPGRLPAQPWCPRGRRGAAARSVDRQIRVSLLWWRSCRRWHLGPGVEWDVPWGPGHLWRSRERCSGRRGSPSGRTRQEHQRSVEKCWSRGRIVSALLAGAQGGCLLSVVPPNPLQARSDGEPLAATPRARSDRSLHQGQREFMKGASPILEADTAGAPHPQAHRMPPAAPAATCSIPRATSQGPPGRHWHRTAHRATSPILGSGQLRCDRWLAWLPLG